MSPAETMGRMRTLAADTAAPEVQRESARLVLDLYKSEYPRIPVSEEIGTAEVYYCSGDELALAKHCAEFVGVEALEGLTERRGKAVASGYSLTFRGPRVAVLGAARLYRSHVETFRELVSLVGSAMRHRVMPLPSVEDKPWRRAGAVSESAQEKFREFTGISQKG